MNDLREQQSEVMTKGDNLKNLTDKEILSCPGIARKVLPSELENFKLEVLHSMLKQAEAIEASNIYGMPKQFAIMQISEEIEKREMEERNRIITLADLLSMNFPDLVFYVDRILTTGLTLLWGFAKTGKSYLALMILLAVSSGGYVLGHLKTRKAAVMLISLEDGLRRLQKRLKDAGAQPNDNFHIFTDWLRGPKGIDKLREYLDANPDIKVVVIDTLFLFAKMADSNDYSATTAIMERLKRIADERDLCIIVLHHSRKTSKMNEGGDISETALGSTGIVAGPDHLLYLVRTPSGQSDAVLHFKSKDAEPAELALNFDAELSGWKYAGEAAELADSDERQEILDLLRDEGQALTTGDIAERLGKKKQAVSNLLQRLLKNEKVRKLGYGLYALPADPLCNPCKDVSFSESYTDTPVTHQSKELEIF